MSEHGSSWIRPGFFGQEGYLVIIRASCADIVNQYLPLHECDSNFGVRR